MVRIHVRPPIISCSTQDALWQRNDLEGDRFEVILKSIKNQSSILQRSSLLMKACMACPREFFLRAGEERRMADALAADGDEGRGKPR